MTQIYEESDFCQICDSTKDIGTMEIAKTVKLRICESCYKDTEKLNAWLEEGIRNAVENSPDYMKLPNGKYIYVGK